MFLGKKVDLKGLDSIPELPRNRGALNTIDLTNAFDKRGILDFGQNVKGYHFIFLETNKDCLIGSVDKVIISDSLVFVLDYFSTNALFMFSYDGSFVRRIGRKGKGPGEYIHIKDFYVDTNNSIVTIHDVGKASLIDYSIIDGQYIKERKIPFRLMRFTKLGERYIYEANSVPNDHIPSINDRALLVGSNEKPITSASLIKNDFSSGDNQLIKVNDSTMSFSLTLNDTIYHTDGNTIISKYLLKFNKKSRLPDDYIERTKRDLNTLRTLFPYSNYTYFIGKYTENNTHLFLRFYHKTY